MPLRSRAPLFAGPPFPKPRGRRALLPARIYQVSECLWWILEDMGSLAMTWIGGFGSLYEVGGMTLIGMDSVEKAVAGGAWVDWRLNG